MDPDTISLLNRARTHAQSLMRDACSPHGFQASGARGKYHNVWARDSMITSLGALACNDPELDATVLASLNTLRTYQTELGLIPNKIDFDQPPRINFRAYADGGLWFVLITARYLARYPSHPDASSLIFAAHRALTWYRYQDHDQSGLIAIQEGSTWMDLFPLRGKSIYVNALRFWATREYAQLLLAHGDSAEAARLEEEAARMQASIVERLWFEPGKDPARLIQDSFSTSSYNAEGYDALGRKLLLPPTELPEYPFFLPYVTMRNYGTWFDTLGNLVAQLSGLASRDQSDAIHAYIDTHKMATPYPIKAIHPVQTEVDDDWRYYFAFADLNRPHQYHNGGIWPMLGGFYIWSLIETRRLTQATEALASLARANQATDADKTGEWEFNEYLSGIDGTPHGMKDQTWSAAMFIVAHDACREHIVEHEQSAPEYVKQVV